MRKQLIILALAALLTIGILACGRDTETPAGAPTTTQSTTSAATTSGAETASEYFAELASEIAESESAAQTDAASSFSAGGTAKLAAESTTRPATAAQPTATATTQAVTRTATTATARATTTAQRTSTTARSVAPTTTAAPKPQTQPSKPVYTEADYAEIIAAVRAYAESKTKVKFIWDTTLTYEYARSGKAGYHDVIDLSQSSGKNFVINELKYNIDLTEDVVSNPMNGVPSSEAHYNVVWFEYQGSIMFCHIYG